MTVQAYFDGGCQPRNPGGHCCWGYLIVSDGRKVDEGSGHIPAGPGNSNNVAEYRGALDCVRALSAMLPPPKRVTIHGDSKLVIQQITGRWRVKGGLYVPVYRELRTEVAACDFEIEWKWIPRAQNWEADELAHRELRERGVAIVLGKAART